MLNSFHCFECYKIYCFNVGDEGGYFWFVVGIFLHLLVSS